MAKLFRIICGIEGMRSVSVEGKTREEVKKKIKETIAYHAKKNWRLDLGSETEPCSPGMYSSAHGWQRSEEANMPQIIESAIDNFTCALSFVKERE